MIVYHLTHTGPYSGTPFCDVDKEQAIERGEKFVHAGYHDRLKDAIICPDCLKIWDDAKDDSDVDATAGSIEQEIEEGRCSLGKTLIVESGRSPFDFFMKKYETPTND